MVDDMKKQMRRFEHLVGFKGRLDVTSRESMKRLIDALDSRYKNDIESSIRLHRLEFFHDLVEGRHKRKEKRDQKTEAPVKKRNRKKSDQKEEEDQQEEIPEEPTETDQRDSDEVLSVRATDIDDWKDLMTLSKIYYVLEHPRSEGLKWKRRIAKKKNVQNFTDKDFIEWRVSQNFRLRGLEEWAQRRTDARKLAEQQHFDMDEIESDDDVKELEQLYEMFDPSGRKYESKERTEKPKKVLSTADRPFKFKDEGIEDWTESYSDDSDYSDEHFVEETDDFKEETERKIPESEGEKELTTEEAEDLAEMFSNYPEFVRYREEVFKRMEKADTTEEWFKIYFESCPTPDELEATRKEPPLITVTEDEEESEPKIGEDEQKVGKLDKSKETGEEAESESGIKQKDLTKEDLKQDESQLESTVKNVIQTLVEGASEPREKKIGIVEEEMDAEIKVLIERMIPILDDETSGKKELLESQMVVEEEKQTEEKSIAGEEMKKETSEQKEKSGTKVGIIEDETDTERKSDIEEVIPILKEETIGENEQLGFQTGVVEGEQQPDTKTVPKKEIQIPEEEIIEKRDQLESQMGIETDTEIESAIEGVVQIPAEEIIGKTKQLEPQMKIGEKTYTESANEEVVQIPEEETIGKTKELESQMGIFEEKDPEAETEYFVQEVIQIPEEETIGKREQLESFNGIDEEEKKSEIEISAKETIQTPEETIELKEKIEVENETVEPPAESMAEEEAQMLREPRQRIDSEKKIIEDGKGLKAEAASKDDESDFIKDGRTDHKVHRDVENSEEVADTKPDSSFKRLEQTQEIENSSNAKEDSLGEDNTSAIKKQSDLYGMQKSVDKINEIADTDEEPLTDMSESETEQSATQGGKQRNKARSSRKRRRKSRIKRSVSYSLFPNENESAKGPSFFVRRSDSQESVLLCAVCSKSITDIRRQDTDEDDGSSSEADYKTEEDVDDEKGTESE